MVCVGLLAYCGLLVYWYVSPLLNSRPRPGRARAALPATLSSRLVSAEAEAEAGGLKMVPEQRQRKRQTFNKRSLPAQQLEKHFALFGLHLPLAGLLPAGVAHLHSEKSRPDVFFPRAS